jgi:23S rRNA (guanosine2251-2'-O)-methyltransferase
MVVQRKPIATHGVYVILHNIRSAHNVGSIFRTADAAGVSKIFLTGYTPAPRDRFGRINKGIAKTALGAETSIPYEHVTRVGPLLHHMRHAGVQCVAVEQSLKAEHYAAFRPHYPVAYLFGNEVRGITSAILEQCDVVLEIPMHGEKESLNVSVTAGVILFHARMKRII